EQATKKTARTRPFRDSSNDTSLVTELFATEQGADLTEAALNLLPHVEGAFAFVYMDEHTLYAARDRHGVRPLSLGRLENGWVVASETAALDIVGAKFVRDVEPGELIAIDEDGLRSHRFAEPEHAPCVFQYLYLARPDSLRAGADGRSAGRGVSGRRWSGHRHPGIGHPGRRRLCRGLGHRLRTGADEERLCREDLHPALTDPAPAGYPPQAQPVAGEHRGQAPRRRRRLDRARQHPAGAGADAAGGRGGGDPRAHLLSAGQMALLLRHRLRRSCRTHRQRTDHERDLRQPRRGFPWLHLPGRHDRRHRAGAQPAVHRLLLGQLPDPRQQHPRRQRMLSSVLTPLRRPPPRRPRRTPPPPTPQPATMSRSERVPRT